MAYKLYDIILCRQVQFSFRITKAKLKYEKRMDFSNFLLRSDLSIKFQGLVTRL